MSNSISPLPLPKSSAFPQIDSTAAAPGGKPDIESFRDLVFQALGEANGLGQAGQNAVAESLAGGDITQVEVLTAVKKADLALRMMLQIRNKLLESYNEIKQMRM